MKCKFFFVSMLCTLMGFALAGCSKGDEPTEDNLTYTLLCDKNLVEVGERITFTVMSSRGEDVTAEWNICDEMFCFTSNWTVYNEPGTHTAIAHMKADPTVETQNTVTITVEGDTNDEPFFPSALNPDATYELYCAEGDRVPTRTPVHLYVKEIVNGEVTNANFTGFLAGEVGTPRFNRFHTGDLTEIVLTEVESVEYDAIYYYSLDGKPVEYKLDPITITSYEREIVGYSENFYHRAFFLKWTGTWCNNCPLLEETLHDAMSVTYYNRVIPMALHDKMENKGDQLNVGEVTGKFYELSTADFGVTGIPTCVIDLNSSLLEVNPVLAKLNPLLAQSLSSDPAKTPGIAIESKLSGRTINCTVKTTSHEDAEYMIGVFFVEDGVVTQQSYPTYTGTMEQNNTFYYSLTKTEESADTFGLHDCGKIAYGEEYVYSTEFEVPVHKFPADFVFDNCRVICIVCQKDASVKPYGFKCRNVATVSVDGSIDYEYEPVYAE